MTLPPRWRTRFLAGLAVLTAGAAAFLLFMISRSRDDLRAVPPLGPAPITLVRGIHLLGGLEPSAAYAVETSAGLVLIDSGLQADARSLRAQLARLKLDWKKLRAILLTHAHGDHSGGAEFLRVRTKAEVYAGRGDAPVLRAGGPREAFFSVFYMPNDVPHPTTVDVELRGGEELDFGDVRLRALATPGHTPGSICYLLERGNLRVLFAGDVISELLGRADSHGSGRNPLGTYSAYLAPRYRGDARDYLASLRKLRALPVPDLVLPGHPRSDPSPQSPRLSQRRWEEMLDRGIRELETLNARYEADGASFLDGTPRRILPDLYYLGDRGGLAVYGFFANGRFFLVNAPGGAGLGDFVKSGLARLGLEAAEPAAVLLTSCDPGEIDGLSDLIEAGRTQVLAPAEGLSAVKAACPAGTVVLSAEDLPGQGWFPATPLPLRGREVATASYLLPWAGKTVLFSGEIPVQFDHETTARLFSELSRSRTTTMDYLLSVQRLDGLHPNVWLPAAPTNGQNANIYPAEWKDIIEKNYGAAAYILRRFGLGLDQELP